MGPGPHASKPSIPVIEFQSSALNFATSLMVIEKKKKKKTLKKKRGEKKKNSHHQPYSFYYLSWAIEGRTKTNTAVRILDRKRERWPPWTLVLHFIISCSPFIQYLWTDRAPKTLHHSHTLHTAGRGRLNRAARTRWRWSKTFIMMS